MSFQSYIGMAAPVPVIEVCALQKLHSKTFSAISSYVSLWGKMGLMKQERV